MFRRSCPGCAAIDPDTGDRSGWYEAMDEAVLFGERVCDACYERFDALREIEIEHDKAECRW